MAKGKQKLTKEELETIDSIRNEASQIFFELGRIAIRRRNVLNQIEDDEEKLENQHDNLVRKENDSIKLVRELPPEIKKIFLLLQEGPENLNG